MLQHALGPPESSDFSRKGTQRNAKNRQGEWDPPQEDLLTERFFDRMMGDRGERKGTTNLTNQREEFNHRIHGIHG